MATSIKITYRGPFFSAARRRVALARMIRGITEDVTEYAERMVRTILYPQIKVRTGYYEAHIQHETRNDHGEVTDGGVIYGPWLEGTSDRNRTTRFKGYASFRKATQVTDREVRRLAMPHVRRFVRELS